MRKTIVVAAVHPWNLSAFKAWRPPRGYRKVLINRREDLTLARLSRLNPVRVFFPHWSWIIPAELYERFECIVFHMTDLPFGRGGTPLQNLIIRGLYRTKLSALRVTRGIDAGDIYMKRPFSLSRGSAEELYRRAATLSFAMMSDMLRRPRKPKAQRGRIMLFSRRRPEESRIPQDLRGRRLYDFIRMLDAPGYPAAYITDGKRRIAFREAHLKGAVVTAKAWFINAL